MGNSSVSGCNGIFYDSGNNNSNYGNNENYTMTICAGSAGSCVRVQFTYFDLENNFDFLRVYDGSNTGAPLLGTYTGSTIPPLLTSSNGCLTFVFESDGVFTEGGWEAIVSCVNCASGGCVATCSGGPAPANDDCSTPQNLGLLPAPQPCPNGMGNALLVNGSNICATAATPYSSLLGCQPAGNMASPASDVWYSFSITGPSLQVSISGGLQNPNVGLYEGTTCGNMIPRGCAIGSNGSVNANFTGLAAGQYFLQVSGGNLNDQCDFTMVLHNNFDCAGCVIQSSVTANPPPVNGTYQAGQTVTFCYTITDYNQTSANWLHSMCPSFGPGWNMSTLVPGNVTDCSGEGTWGWYNTTVTSSATGQVFGPGFFYESDVGNPGGVTDGNPGNNYGDNNPGGCDWTFCFTITTMPPAQCVQGASLNIAINTSGDGESGSWTSVACNGDPTTTIFATSSCCTPPVINVNDPLCSNETGSVTAQGQGSGPWDYVWKNNLGVTIQTNNNINGASTANGLAPGTYSIAVTDNSGCTATSTFTVSAPPQLTVSLTEADPSCNGATNGSISTTVNGGTPGYSYAWTPSGSGSQLNNIGPGNYSVVVTDANGCTASAATILAPGAAINVSISASSDITCNGGSDGSATASANGGTAPYNYLWSNGSITATAPALPAGTYTVTATDANGCSNTASVTLTQPLALDLDMSSIDATCGNSNGSAAVVVNGGSAPYQYQWSAPGATSTINGLAAGTYTVTVTDNEGCTAFAFIGVNNTSGPAVSISSSSDVSCFGADDGSATASVNGGALPLVYNWTPSGGSGTIASGLSPGNYTFTVTDASGCTASASVTINEPDELQLQMNASDISCYGMDDGTADVTATGGVQPYDYLWNNSSSSNSINALTAGTYTVTVTDASGCTADGQVTITEPDEIILIMNFTDATCGSSNGSADVTASGGNGGFQYQWSAPGGNNPALNNLSAGTYTVTVTDSDGCTAESDITVGNTTGPVITIDASTDISCFGANDGEIITSVNGGALPLVYAWSSGGSGTSSSGLSPGTYTITVTDASGCTSEVSVQLSEPDEITVILSPDDIICNSAANGSITSNVSGGTAPYTYLWNDGSVTDDLNNLNSGTYTLTVTDASGCTLVTQGVINEPAALSVNFPVITDPGCSVADGTIDAAASGGVAPYTWLWSTGDNTSSVSSLGTGTYTVTVTDDNGCTAMNSVAITAPASPVLSLLSITDVTCFGLSDGTAEVEVNGGTPPYTYNWVPSGGNTTKATGLTLGNYNVTVTDANGCTADLAVTIAEPDELLTNTASTDVVCNGGNQGSAWVNASGGTGGLHFEWSDGTLNDSIISVSAGTYTVTVTDANNCSVSNSVVINEPPSLDVSIDNITDATCGLSNGSVTVSASGGTGALTYTWNPSVSNSNTASGLAAGSYQVSVEDQNGCITDITASVQSQGGPAVSINASSDVTCPGGSDGSAEVIVNSGNGPYTYNWVPSGGNLPQASGLTAGNYTVDVSDANGCIGSVSVTITEPDNWNIQPSVTPSNCNQPDGSITLVVTGATPGYTYQWSGGIIANNSANGLASGPYTITVTDSHGCTSDINVMLQGNAAPVLNLVSYTDISCNGLSDGNADVNVNGGTAPYSWLWSDGSTDEDLSGAGAGTYTVTVTDISGCEASLNVTLNEPDAINVVFNTTDATCGMSNGSAEAVISGGITPYSLEWSDGSASAQLNNIPAGAYTLTITDANGCAYTQSAAVANAGGPVISLSSSGDADCAGNATGYAAVSVNSGAGPYDYEWSPNVSTSDTAFGLTAGNYIVTATDQNGCSAVISIDIAEPDPVIVNQITTDVTCFGGSDGTASIDAFGGTAPYTYDWTPGGLLPALRIGLPANNYAVKVTDVNGCTGNTVAPVAEPAQLILILNSIDPGCNSGTDGDISSAINGGIPPYNFTWSTGSVLQDLNGITAGSYTLTVSDNNGCTISASAVLNDPDALSLSFDIQPATCGNPDGSADVTVSGGTGTYQYDWSSGGNSSLEQNLLPGTYTVTVTDQSGCSTDSTISIPSAGGPQIAVASVTDVSCFGGNDGAATVTVNGGTSPFTYLWLPAGGSGLSASNLNAGTYSVEVTDANGCVSSVQVDITEPDALNVLATSYPETCGSANGAVAVQVSGGVSPYTFLWNTGSASDSISSLIPGNYTVTVTDANNCISSMAATVQAFDGPAIAITDLTHLSCFNSSDGSVTVQVNGTGPFTYDWTPNLSNGPALTNIPAGTYNLQVTDPNGCISDIIIDVTQPDALQLIASSTPSMCGIPNGTASVTVSGGITPYSYLWSDGSNTSSLSSLVSGNFTVTVTDANGCSGTETITVLNATGPVPVILNITQPSCNGFSDGSVLLDGGIAGQLTYSWLPYGGNTEFADSLSAGTYYVTVIDVNGCSGVVNIIVPEPDVVSMIIDSSLDISCFGGNDGYISVNASGGTLPYSYLWSDGSSGFLNTDLDAGSYSVTVTDANGCAYTMNHVLSEPSLLIASAVSQDVSCYNGSNGSVSVSASGGTGPYNYLWSNSQSGASISQLNAGYYSCIITDANGCTVTAGATVYQPSQLVLNVVNTDMPDCFGGNDGSASISVSGGVSPYQVIWSNGATGNDLTNVISGTYIVTVTDANNCILTDSVILSQPTDLTISDQVTNVDCYGNASGGIEIMPMGGTFPYNIQWANPGLSGFSVDSLIAGVYSAVITDANNCPENFSRTITQPFPLSISINTPDTICIGQQTLITSLVSGGTSPYNFLWSDGNILSQNVVNPSVTTTYSVIVTDNNGCIALSPTTTVAVFPALSVQLTIDDNEICEGEDVNLTAVANGGNGGPYTFLWNNSIQGSSTLNSSPANDSLYTVMIEDGCGTPSANASVSVIVHPLPLPSFIPPSPGCMPLYSVFTNQSVTEPGSGYSWNFGDNHTSTAASPIHIYEEAGIYDVVLTIVSPFGCTDSMTINNAVEVYELPVAEFSMTPESPSIFLPEITFMNQSISAVSSHWDFGDNTPGSQDWSPVHVYGDTGIYTITLIVTSNMGCIDSAMREVYVKPDGSLFIPNAFTPNGDGNNDGFTAYGIGITSASYRIFDRWGKLVFAASSLEDKWDGTDQNGNECAQDVYVYLFKVKGAGTISGEYSGRVTLVR